MARSEKNKIEYVSDPVMIDKTYEELDKEILESKRKRAIKLLVSFGVLILLVMIR